MAFEIPVFQSLHGWTGQSGMFDWFVVLAANILPYFLLAGAIILIFKITPPRKRIWTFLFSAIVLIVSRGVLTELIRFIYYRPRPNLALESVSLFPELSASFPSGHAVFYFALALIVYSFDKKWGYIFFGAVFINGLARVVAGVHWPTDIIGGWCIAFVCFYFINHLLVKYALPPSAKEDSAVKQ